MACLAFYVESYQIDICRFRAMTLSPFQLVVNWPVFTIYFISDFTFFSAFGIVAPTCVEKQPYFSSLSLSVFTFLVSCQRSVKQVNLTYCSSYLMRTKVQVNMYTCECVAYLRQNISRVAAMHKADVVAMINLATSNSAYPHRADDDLTADSERERTMPIKLA